MTTFEITIITLLALIAFALIFRDFVIGKALDQIIYNQDAMQQDIQRIEVNTHHASSVLQDSIAPDVETLSNNFQYLLDGKKGVPALFDIVDKMHRNLCVEIADKMVDRVCPPTNTIKVEGRRCELTDEELTKRINEDNKED